jgi:hypothetical protein
MANSAKLQKQITTAKAQGKEVFVFCMYGPGAYRKNHNTYCCSVFTFSKKDRRGIATARRLLLGP